jgi:hypothetical protein
MGDSRDKRVPLLLWPFYGLWRLVTFILNVVGRLVCALLGLGLMVTGMAVAMSIIALPIGIALSAFGFLLLARALF